MTSTPDCVQKTIKNYSRKELQGLEKDWQDAAREVEKLEEELQAARQKVAEAEGFMAQQLPVALSS